MNKREDVKRNERLREKVKNKKSRFDIRFYYDLYPELWEKVRREIMDEKK